MTLSPSPFQQTWQRMLSAINARNDSSLAKFLSISPAGVSSAKSKQKIPQAWFDKICQETGISPSWLMGDQPFERQAALDLEIPPPASHRKISPRPVPTAPTLPDPPDFNVAEIISQAIEVLESKTDFSQALVASIRAFHKAMQTEKQMTDFNAEMMEAFALFQKKQRQD